MKNIKSRLGMVIIISALLLQGCSAVENKKSVISEKVQEAKNTTQSSISFLIKSESSNLGKIRVRPKGEDEYEAKTYLEPGSYEFTIQNTESAESYFCESVLESNSSLKMKKAEKNEKSVLYISRTSKYIFNIKKEKEGGYIMKIIDTKPYKEEEEKIDGEIVWRNNKATVKADITNNEMKKYTMKSTIPPRNSTLNGSEAVFEESADSPYVRSGNTMFDALFALAIHEAKQNSVSEITDGSFNNGKPVKLEAYQTGEEWHYVWTRDTAYSVALGLGFIDPIRSMNSLAYKTSEKRAENKKTTGSSIEIVQDTGSGGSWPISSDRVTWAFGAWETLKCLDGEAKNKFTEMSYNAIVNTVENDRIAVYDSADGLYRGEQSFLDWREQTYPIWTQADTAHVGMSKTLSTNCAHYAAIIMASKLTAEKGEKEKSEKYKLWAEKLKVAINKEFWMEDKGLYSSMKGTELDNVAMEKYDALGESLAVITGVADEDRAEKVVSSYPHVEAGPPVIWPQLPEVPPYHNRAIWPFVTAFEIKSGIIAKNTAVVNHNVNAMIRASAMNISNMENYEFLSGLSSYTDKLNGTGPVINSKRQLWSVAGYISMVLESIAGVKPETDGIAIEPFITVEMRNKEFGNSDSFDIKNIKYKGKIVDLKINLPKKSDDNRGYYLVDEVILNNKTLKTNKIDEKSLEVKNVIVVNLGKVVYGSEKITISDVKDYRNINNDEYREIFAPREPKVEIELSKEGKAVLKIDSNKEKNVVFNIYKNGKLYAKEVKENVWTDNEKNSQMDKIAVLASDEKFQTNNKLTVAGSKIKYLPKWGKPEEVINVVGIKPGISGKYYLKTIYANAHNTVNTGITACVKLVDVFESEGDKNIGKGVITMPHLSSWKDWGNSTLVPVYLEKGKEYNVKISDYGNMSYFEHFAIYNGEGGTGGAVNTAHIAEVELIGGGDYYSVESQYVGSGNKSHHSLPKTIKP